MLRLAAFASRSRHGGETKLRGLRKTGLSHLTERATGAALRWCNRQINHPRRGPALSEMRDARRRFGHLRPRSLLKCPEVELEMARAFEATPVADGSRSSL